MGTRLVVFCIRCVLCAVSAVLLAVLELRRGLACSLAGLKFENCLREALIALVIKVERHLTLLWDFESHQDLW